MVKYEVVQHLNVNFYVKKKYIYYQYFGTDMQNSTALFYKYIHCMTSKSKKIRHCRGQATLFFLLFLLLPGLHLKKKKKKEKRKKKETERKKIKRKKRKKVMVLLIAQEKT